MEKYIQKINDKITKDNDMVHARKVKKFYQILGGVILAVGLAGFVALFVAFMILFLKFETDEAFTCWLIAIPFLLMLVPGSVLARIGDTLLPYDKESAKKKKTKQSEPAKEENNAQENTTEQ